MEIDGIYYHTPYCEVFVMFGSWIPHKQYQRNLIARIIFHSGFQPGRVQQLKNTILKLFYLNLDKILSVIKPLYSNTGAPSKEQAGIIRSFVLMLDQKRHSITAWAEIVANDPLLYDICGFNGKAPAASSYYDFIDRLWLGSKEAERQRKKKVRIFQSKPRLKLKQGQKLPPKHKGEVSKLVKRAILGTLRSFRKEQLMQEFFSRLVVDTSAAMGLLGDTKALSVAGDGSPYCSGASHYGVKVCDCKAKGIYNCHCPRRYSDPDATWGWDSYRERYYFGDTLYAFTAIGTDHDLPIYLRTVDARRHDSITTIFALQEIQELLPEFTIRDAVFDSAMDNYPTYKLCKHSGIRPFIALNDRTKDDSSEDNSDAPERKLPKGVSCLDDKGRPICLGGIPYTYWGPIEGKGLKYRCWFAAHKRDCPCCCSPSPYGRTVYLKPDDDLRLFPPLARDSETFKKKLRQRSGSERINKRVFVDYDVENGHMRDRKQRFFRAVIAAVNVHLDEWIKHIKSKWFDLLPGACLDAA